jgi:hypothetical protein
MAGPCRCSGWVIDELGGVPPRRILLDPPPGTATEEHVCQRVDSTTRLCELVEGILVEKALGYRESLLAAALLALLKPCRRFTGRVFASSVTAVRRAGPTGAVGGQSRTLAEDPRWPGWPLHRK